MERRITIDRLWFEFGKDELYGEEFPGLGETKSIQAVESILKAIGFNKTGFRLKAWCRKCIPGNDYPPLTLALVLCGMDELKTFLPGEKEPTGWKYESFSKNFRDDLEINLNDLKYLMRRRELPLPVSLFPKEQGNTEEAIRLDEKEYSEAFTAFAAISDIEREIDEWKKKNALTITEKIMQEQKVSELESELQKMKVPPISRELYPELSIDALTKIADLDAELYPSPYDTGLGGELDERLGKLQMDGYEPEQASKILDAIIRKGEELKVIAERESLPCQSQSDIDSRDTAIKKARSNIEEINRELDNGVVTQQKNVQTPAETSTEYNETPQYNDALKSYEPLDGAFASEVTITVLENQWLEVTKVGCKSQKVHCATLQLLQKSKAKLNRAGEMLYSLLHNKTSTKLKAPEQAMKELRKILRNSIGISDDTFSPVNGGWEPLLTLLDKRNSAKARETKKLARLHSSYNDEIHCESGSVTMERPQNPEEELISKQELEEDSLFIGGSAEDEDANQWVNDNKNGD